MNFKRIFFIALLISYSLTCFAQDNNKSDCAILKHGTFKYLDIDDTTAYVVINYYNKKYYIKSDIVWVSACEYNMTMTDITIPDFPYAPGDVMNVVINKIDEGLIYYTSTVKGKTWKGRLKII